MRIKTVTTDRLVWWAQLLESSAFENAEAIRAELDLQWGGFMRIRWAVDVPMPDSVEGYGFDVTEIPDIIELFGYLQPMLEDREYMIVKLTLDKESFAPSTEYHILTKRIVAKVSGEELAERAKRLVMASEEELLNQDETS